MTFYMIMQLWNTNIPVIVSCDADMTGNTCTFQWSLEREFMYFAGKLLYLIVLASVQLAVKDPELFHIYWQRSNDKSWS